MLIYVGSYSDRLHLLRLDAADGRLEAIGSVPAGPGRPSFLAFAPGQRFVYAVNEFSAGAATAFALDADGLPHVLNTMPTEGADPCHLVVAPDGRQLFVANYSSGQITVLPIREDGTLCAASQVITHRGHSVHPTRQTSPHAHCVTLSPDGTRLHVADLGLDRILTYAIDNGRLTEAAPPFAAAPGAGPRQIIFHPVTGRAYVLNELAATLMLPPGGDQIDMLPAGYGGKRSAAELQASPDGRHLYASNRGHDSIAVFALAPDGSPIPRGHIATLGQSPRHFAITADGAYLLAANQDSDSVVVFRRDAETGLAAPTGVSVSVPKPVCLRFG